MHVTGFIEGLVVWMQPPDTSIGRKSWIVTNWPGKPPELANCKPTLQVLLEKRAVYVKPVEHSEFIKMDKFQGVQVSFSRFGGSIRETLNYCVTCGFWPSHGPQRAILSLD